MSTVKVTAVNAPGVGGTRNRAGFLFGPEPKVVEVTDEQLEQLKEDSVLMVEDVPEDETGSATYTVPGAAEAMKELSTAEDVDAFIEGDDRVGVEKAAEARKKELEG